MTTQPLHPYHQPVMLEQVLWGLAVSPGGRYIDCTVGDGGHAAAILEAAWPSGRLLGMDRDPEAIAVSRERLSPFGTNALVVQESYGSLETMAHSLDLFPVQGVLFDLGISSRQVDLEERGFSFQRPGPLDMRFDPAQTQTAADFVNEMEETELANIIYQFGQEPRSRRIARAIVAHRPFTSTVELGEVVRQVAGYRRGRTHPATRVFQALRIAVNQELELLAQGLEQAVRTLDHGGRLVTIAYHSLEDRIIKEFLRGQKDSLESKIKQITKHVIKPTPEEIQQNRRGRSAKLRVAERA